MIIHDVIGTIRVQYEPCALHLQNLYFSYDTGKLLRKIQPNLKKSFRFGVPIGSRIHSDKIDWYSKIGSCFLIEKWFTDKKHAHTHSKTDT